MIVQTDAGHYLQAVLDGEQLVGYSEMFSTLESVPLDQCRVTPPPRHYIVTWVTTLADNICRIDYYVGRYIIHEEVVADEEALCYGWLLVPTNLLCTVLLTLRQGLEVSYPR